jgi:hypothetical protein
MTNDGLCIQGNAYNMEKDDVDDVVAYEKHPHEDN